MSWQQVLLSAILSIPLGFLGSWLIMRYQAAKAAALEKAREQEAFRKELLDEIHKTLDSYARYSNTYVFLDYLGLDALVHIQSMLHDFKNDADAFIKIKTSESEIK